MLIKCSRCGCVKDVPEQWQYKECVSCHERTVERFQKKTFEEKLLEDLNPLVSYDTAKREKLIANLLSEPSKEEQLPEQSKPKDYGEEWQKRTYEQQTKEAKEKQQTEQQQQPEAT